MGASAFIASKCSKFDLFGAYIMYEEDDEELWGYRSRYAAWMKKNNWKYEAGGGEPINEKPMRLGNF